jgi:hypothetical protein
MTILAAGSQRPSRGGMRKGAAAKRKNTMKITDEKWNEIIAETRAGIEDLNAWAKRNGQSDTFHCEIDEGQDFTKLVTTRSDGERRAVAREKATGELRTAKPVVRTNFRGYKITTPDPKSWQNLSSKSASEVGKKLKLLSFSSRWTVTGSGPSSAGTVYRGQIFSQEEAQRLEQICADQNVGMDQAILVLRGNPTKESDAA